MKRLIIYLMLVLGMATSEVRAQYIINDIGYLCVDNEAWVYEYFGSRAIVAIPSEIKINNDVYPVTLIDGVVFANHEEIVKVTISENVKEIGDRAFDGCENLWIVQLPQSLTKIGNYAFSGAKELQALILPNSELEIGDYAFAECERLNFILVPEKVKSFGDFAFYNCKNIHAIFGLGTVAPARETYTFLNTVGGERNVYYPEGYADGWSAYSGLNLIPRTAPAVCIDIVSAEASVGQSMTISATAYGYLGATIESIEWESRNTNVMTVDQSGKLTAIGEGTTDVYCTVTDSNGETASANCTIRVVESSGIEDVEIDAIEMPAEYFTLQGLSAGTDREALTPGIYIRRQGREATKIIIR